MEKVYENKELVQAQREARKKCLVDTTSKKEKEKEKKKEEVLEYKKELIGFKHEKYFGVLKKKEVILAEFDKKLKEKEDKLMLKLSDATKYNNEKLNYGTTGSKYLSTDLN